MSVRPHQPSYTNLQARPRFWPSPKRRVLLPMRAPRLVKVSAGRKPAKACHFNAGTAYRACLDLPILCKICIINPTNWLKRNKESIAVCLWPRWIWQCSWSWGPHFPCNTGQEKSAARREAHTDSGEVTPKPTPHPNQFFANPASPDQRLFGAKLQWYTQVLPTSDSSMTREAMIEPPSSAGSAIPSAQFIWLIMCSGVSSVTLGREIT